MRGGLLASCPAEHSVNLGPSTVQGMCDCHSAMTLGCSAWHTISCRFITEAVSPKVNIYVPCVTQARTSAPERWQQ